MTPTATGHDSTLYVREYAPPGEVGYFTSRMHGASGSATCPASTTPPIGSTLATRPLTALAGDLARHRDAEAAVLTGFDPGVDALLPRGTGDRLAQVLDELRLVKDEWELARLQYACDVTARGFADVVRELPNVLGRPDVRGERWLEGTFWRRARLEGNEVGYTSIVGAGSARHRRCTGGATTARSRPGQLLLADMGVETDELYTADVTRTMPVNGDVDARAAEGLPRRAGGAGRRHRRGQGRRRLPRRAPGRDVGAGRPPAQLGHPAGDGRGLVRRRPRPARRRAAPPLHAARHLAHARHRRARLRAGPQRALPRRHPDRRARAHRRARPVLPGQRPHRAGRTARHRRPDRGRHRRHRRRRRSTSRRRCPATRTRSRPGCARCRATPAVP